MVRGGHRVISPRIPGIAAHDTPQRHETTTPRTMACKGITGIMAA